MLLAIREHAKGWIAWVVIVLIGAAFALFGLSSYMGPSGGSRAVATINGNDINPDMVSQAYREQRRQIEQMMGDRFDPAMINDRQLRREALDRVIDDYLLSEFIDSQRLRLSDQDLAAVIRSQEVFQEDGRFSSERYHQLLRANRLNSNQYEAQVRRMALMQQVQGAIGETALVTDREVEQVIGLQRQEREISYLTLSPATFRDTVSVDDEAVRAYYEQNPESFMSPETVELNWVELRRDDLLAEMEISDEDLRARYEQVKDSRFTETESREVRHILVQLDQDADAETEESVKKRIEDLRSRIEGGASFPDIASQSSEDSGSASMGGGLGEVERGDMVPSFEEAAFSLKEGELSQPVRSQFGFHLIEVTAIHGGETQPFGQVREQLQGELAEERVNNRFFEQSRRLDELVYEWPDSLEEAADALGLEVQSTGRFSRDGADEGIGSHEAVVNAAFSEPVLSARQNSELLQLADDHYVVIRVAKHQPSEPLAFEEVADDIRDQLRHQRAAEAAHERAAELFTRLQSGEAPDELAASEDDLEVQQAGFVSRQDDALPAAVLQEAFRLERPQADGRSVGQSRLDGGEYALVVVSGVRDGDVESVNDEERQRLRDQLQTAYAQEATQDFIRELRAQADIEIFEDRL